MSSLYQMSPPRFALVRPLPASFAQALSEKPPITPIDLALAQHQHQAYVSALRSAVGEVVVVDAADECPDCCFIEDTVVIVGRQAMITRPGAPSRRIETSAVAASLERLRTRGEDLVIEHLSDAALLDGGDVLYVGGRLFIGLSRRTTATALEEMRARMDCPVHGIEVDEGLHLKSMLSALDDQTLVVAEHPSALRMATEIKAVLGAGGSLITVPDASAANVLRLGRYVLIQDGFPQSSGRLQSICGERGLMPVSLKMSEFIKADGALTCCSVIIP